MHRSYDSSLCADMTTIPSAPEARQPSRGYAASRAAATRPILALSLAWASRHPRAVQLSWVGLVRR
jgi:hypothetical protein